MRWRPWWTGCATTARSGANASTASKSSWKGWRNEHYRREHPHRRDREDLPAPAGEAVARPTRAAARRGVADEKRLRPDGRAEVPVPRRSGAELGRRHRLRGAGRRSPATAVLSLERHGARFRRALDVERGAG